MSDNQRESFLKHVANNIRLTVKRKGMTLKELSDKTGISEQGMQLILRTGNIKLPVFYDIANALGVEFSELLGDYCKTVEPNEVVKMRELLAELLTKANK